MSQREITPTTILSEAEVRAIVAGVRSYFAEWFDKLPQQPDIESSVRLGSLGKQCAARRSKMRLPIKEAARLLRVPQYRLKAIEGGSREWIQGRILRAYIAHLGMNAWYKQWQKANPTLALKLEGEAAG